MNNKPNDTTWQARWGEKALSKGVTVIPTAFLQHAARAGLKPAQQLLLIHLVSYWWKASRDPFPSFKELRKRTGMSERAISGHLKVLEEKMWIGRKRRYNNSYRYDLDRLARRIAWLSGDLTAMAREEFQPDEAAPPSPATPPTYELQVEEEAPPVTDSRFTPSFEDMTNFMEEDGADKDS